VYVTCFIRARRTLYHARVYLNIFSQVSVTLSLTNEDKFTNQRLHRLYSLIQSHITPKDFDNFITPAPHMARAFSSISKTGFEGRNPIGARTCIFVLCRSCTYSPRNGVAPRNKEYQHLPKRCTPSVTAVSQHTLGSTVRKLGGGEGENH
jgi:hypothetical protein